MLYSSVLALSLVAPSEGFSKEKDHHESAKETSFQADGKPISEAQEDLHDKAIIEASEVAQKKQAFTRKITEVINKYTVGLRSVLGADIKAEEQLKEKSDKIVKGLTDFDPKIEKSFEQVDEYSENLVKQLESKHKFIMAQKASIGGDIEWFEDVHKYALAQLKKLTDLRNEMKNTPERLKSLARVYNERMTHFLPAFSVFTVCASYLGNGKAYCHDKEIKHQYMKRFFQYFTDSEFQASAGAVDMVIGDKKAPLTSAFDNHVFYSIETKTVALDHGKEFTIADISSDPADEKILLLIKKTLTSSDPKDETAKMLMKPEMGGLILSSRLMYLDGMSKPLCVYCAISFDVDQGKIKGYTLRYFSMVEKTEKADLTKQYIDLKNEKLQKEIETASAKLQADINAMNKEDAAKEEEKAKSKQKDTHHEETKKSKSKQASKHESASSTTVASSDSASEHESRSSSEHSSDEKKADKPTTTTTASSESSSEHESGSGDKKSAKAASSESSSEHESGSDDKKSTKAASSESSSEHASGSDDKKSTKAASSESSSEHASGSDDKKSTKPTTTTVSGESDKHSTTTKSATTTTAGEEKKGFFSGLFGGSSEKTSTEDKDKKTAPAAEKTTEAKKAAAAA